MQETSLIRGYASPVNALIVGATGAIGLALATALGGNSQVDTLFLVARTASSNLAVSALAANDIGRVVVIDCDICDEMAITAMAALIKTRVSHLHLTINASGALQGTGMQVEKSLTQVTMASLQKAFAINAFGPVLLAKALLPLMRETQPAVFASLSARVGSISDNHLGGWYSYRAAKAAQNQLLKTMSIELKRLNTQSIVLALHPGTTDSALSKPFQRNVPPSKLFSPAFVAKALLHVISQRGPADSGNFYAWDGQAIPY